MNIAGLVFLSSALVFAGCASRTQPTPASTVAGPAPVTVDPGLPVLKSLAGTRWIVVQLDGLAVSPTEPGWPAQSLELDAAGTGASGHAGVNRFGCRFAQDGPALSFGPLALTRRAGPPEQMAIEQRYTLVLSRVVGWRQDGIHLALVGPGEQRLALLRPVGK